MQILIINRGYSKIMILTKYFNLINLSTILKKINQLKYKAIFFSVFKEEKSCKFIKCKFIKCKFIDFIN